MSFFSPYQKMVVLLHQNYREVPSYRQFADALRNSEMVL